MRTAVYNGERLIPLRNPWGSVEWNGAWSDGAPQWSVDAKVALDQTDADDGLFWMSFDDFCSHFDEIDIVKVFPEAKWTTQVQVGKWEGESAAGRFHYAPAPNPQFLLDVEQRGVAVVALRQKEARFTGDDKLENVHIGMHLMKAPTGARIIHFHEDECIINTDPWIDAREIAKFLVLEKGKYILAASPFAPVRAAATTSRPLFLDLEA